MRELSLEELNLVSGGDGTAGSPPDPTGGGAIQSNPATITPIIQSMQPTNFPLTGNWFVDNGQWCTSYPDAFGAGTGTEDFCFPLGVNILQAGDDIPPPG